MANADSAVLTNLKTVRDEMLTRGGAKRVEINGRSVTFHSLIDIERMISVYQAKVHAGDYGASMDVEFEEVS